MNEAELLTIILLMGLAFGLIANFLVKNILYSIDNIRDIMRNNKMFAKKMAEVEKMKADGEFHEWISVVTPSGEMLVCKKTGWCPELKGFLPMDMLRSYLEKIKMEEEYREYRNLRVQKLAVELGFDLDKMEQIVEKIFSIKKDFHVERVRKLSEELAQRAEDVRKQQEEV